MKIVKISYEIYVNFIRMMFINYIFYKGRIFLATSVCLISFFSGLLHFFRFYRNFVEFYPFQVWEVAQSSQQLPSPLYLNCQENLWRKVDWCILLVLLNKVFNIQRLTLHRRRKNLTSSLHSSMRSFLSLPFRLPLFLSLSLSPYFHFIGTCTHCTHLQA